MIGSNIEHYKIVGILGEGGMGIVYKAFDLKLERYVALKILNAQATTNPQFLERFRREAKHQAKLTHNNIVPVYGLTEQRQTFGIVMEYVEGETLEHLIEKKGRLELKEALLLVKQILTGTSYAHKKGFIHRDIKPSNIIINIEGTAKIMDFGISKSLTEIHGITKTGTKIGTILYMSPEQIKAYEPTNQSDIYSIGITFFEMLAGKTPFDAATEFEIMEAHLKKAAPKLSATYNNLPAEVDRIISKALNKTLAKRYVNCEEFLEDIDKLVNSLDNVKNSKRREVTKTENKKKEPVGSRIKFYIFAFFFLVTFLFFSFYFFHTIVDLWDKATAKNQPDQKVTQEAVLSGIKFRPVQVNTSSSFSAINFLDDTVGIACGSAGTIIKTTDGGNTWFSVGDTSFGNLYSITFQNRSKGFITGENGIIITSSDQGRTWKKSEQITGNSLFNIYFIDNINGFIVGGNGTILKTADGGLNWDSINSPTGNTLFSICFATKSEGFIVGWNGEILKTTDKGNTWIKRDKISDKYFRSVAFISEKTGFLVGGGGEIYRTNNSGNNWDLIPSNTISGLSKIRFLNEKEGIIVGGGGDILFTSNSGEKWDKIQNNIYFPLTDMTVTPSGKIFIVGQYGTILKN